MSLHDDAAGLQLPLVLRDTLMPSELSELIVAIRTAQHLGFTIIATYAPEDADETPHVWFGALSTR